MRTTMRSLTLEEIEPYMADEELSAPETASAISLWWAIHPFDK
jgi:pre-mRNA-processing factor 8